MKGKRGTPDTNQTAFNIVGMVTGDVDTTENEANKNRASVALGRLGGMKGGKARATTLSAERRAEIAKTAAAAHWKKGTI